MTYSLEATIEAERLEEQVYQTNYSIEDELSGFRFDAKERVMDAGCGTGVLSRYLIERRGLKQIDALDFSDLRLRQGTQLLDAKTRSAIRFRRQDLSQIDADFKGVFDTILCRYVIEHTADPAR